MTPEEMVQIGYSNWFNRDFYSNWFNRDFYSNWFNRDFRKEEKMSKKKKEKRENEWSFTAMPEDFNWNRIIDEALKAGYRYGVINVNKQPPCDGYMNIVFLRKDIQDKINIHPGFCQTKRWYFIDDTTTLRSEWDKRQKVVSFSTLKLEMYLKEIIGKIIEYDEQKEKLLTVKVECY